VLIVSKIKGPVISSHTTAVRELGPFVRRKKVEPVKAPVSAVL